MNKHTPTHRQTLAALALFAALAVVFGAPALKNPANWGVIDWDQFLFYSETARQSILEYHQAPLWSPAFCGGNVLLANPQSQFLSPSWLLVLFFGSLLGLKLKIFLMIFVGLGGMYYLCRTLGRSFPASVFGAVVFQLSGTYFAYTANGQQWIQALPLMPWALAFFLDSARERWRVVPAAVFAALMWFEGGIYPFPFALLLMGLCAVFFAGRPRPAALAENFLLVCALAFLLGAVKFLPFLETFASSRRELPLEAHDIVSLRLAWQAFLQADTAAFRGHYHYWEYFGLIGWIPAALAAASLFRFRAEWRWWGVFAVVFLLMLGVSSPLPLWAALHELQFFSSMHVTSRFRMVLLVPIAVLGAGAIDWLRAALAGRRFAGEALAALAVALTIATFFQTVRPVLGRAFILPPRPVERAETFTQRWRLPDYGSSWSMYPAALSGVGTVACYEYFTIPGIPMSGKLIKSGMARPAGSPFYKGEVYLTRAAGTARYTHWSHGRLEIALEAAAPGALIVNQNYDPHWRAWIDGRPARLAPGDDKLLRVRVPAGKHKVTLKYQSRAFAAGAAISLVAWLFAAAAIARGCRKTASE